MRFNASSRRSPGRHYNGKRPDMRHNHGPLRVGIGGPVGSGKTALLDLLCKTMRERYDTAAITNYIYNQWYAEFLARPGSYTAASVSPEVADLTIYVIDVAAGDKIPSKGGPGITRSDLLVINKIDLAPYVGASLEKMDTDARRMRGERPFVMTNLKKSEGLGRIISFIEAKGGLSPAAQAKSI